MENFHDSMQNVQLKHSDISREKHNLRKQVNEIEYLIKLLSQEINLHERTGIKIKTVANAEIAVSQQREKEETKVIKLVTDDINRQVNSLNN